MNTTKSARAILHATVNVHTRFDCVRVAVSTILYMAALLKTYQLATEPTANTTWFDSRWFLTLIVQFEFFLATWLLFGVWEHAARILSMICFGSFGCLSLWMIVLGEQSCGCFGIVDTSPWFTFVLDATICATLIVSRHSPATMRPKRLVLAAVLVFLCAGVSSAYAIATYAPNSLSDAINPDESKFVLLEPTQWLYQRFPLEKHIEDGHLLQDGVWRVVLFRHDCPHCVETLREYSAMADQLESTDTRLALVEVPPYGNTISIPHEFSEHFVWSRLKRSRKWFVQTPVEISLKDGYVVEVVGPP